MHSLLQLCFRHDLVEEGMAREAKRLICRKERQHSLSSFDHVGHHSSSRHSFCHFREGFQRHCLRNSALHDPKERQNFVGNLAEILPQGQDGLQMPKTDVKHVGLDRDPRGWGQKDQVPSSMCSYVRRFARPLRFCGSLKRILIVVYARNEKHMKQTEIYLPWPPKKSTSVGGTLSCP